MKAVILAGGLGERLRPLTCSRPKPLARVCGREVLWYVLELLRRSGVEECAITVRRGAEAVRRYAEKISAPKIEIFEEKEPLGTAGSLKACEGFADEETLVISGDVVCDFDLAKALDFHRKNRAEATLLLTRVNTPTEYGAVRLAADGRIERFREKPRWEQVCSDRVNSGIYILDKSVFSLIEEGKPCDFGGELFPRMVREGRAVYGYNCDGYWCDIGSVEAYLACNAAVLDGQVSYFAPPCVPTLVGVRIIPPVIIAEGCEIGAGSVIGPYAVLGAGCHIGERARIEKTVIGCGCFIGEDVICEGAALDERAGIGRGAEALAGAALGEGARVGAGARLEKGVHLTAGAVLNAGERLVSGASGDFFGASLFGENGVEGKAGREITAPACARIGAAVGTVRRGKTAVGFSGENAELYACSLGAALADAGCDVFYIEDATPGLTRFITAFCGFRSGLSLSECGGVMQLRLFGENGLAPENMYKLRSVLLREAFALGQAGGQYRVRGAWERMGGYADSLCGRLDGLRVRVESEDAVLRAAASHAFEAKGAVLSEAEDAITASLERDGERFTLTQGGTDYPDTQLIPLLFEQGRGFAPAWLPFSGEADPDAPEGYLAAPENFDNLLCCLKIFGRLGKRTLAQLCKDAPRLAVESRVVEASDGRARTLERLRSLEEEKREGDGLIFSRGGATVRVYAVGDREALRVVSAAASSETADEMCGFFCDIIESAAGRLDN